MGLLAEALATSLPRWPRKITLDGHAPIHQALRLLRRQNRKWKYVLVRNCPYLNNMGGEAVSTRYGPSLR